MSEEQERLLADIRALTCELATPRLSLVDQEYLKLCADILRQVRADGAPGYPILQYMKQNYGAERDNDGQTVYYVDEREDHSERCDSCGEPFEVQVEDGEPCLECQAGEE